MVIHMGIVATMFARYPKTIDFSCGFQSYLPAGTCSKARFDRSISRLISANRYSFNLISDSSSETIVPFMIPLGLFCESDWKELWDQNCAEPHLRSINSKSPFGLLICAAFI